MQLDPSSPPELLTAAELAEIEARATAATAGPWAWRERDHNALVRRKRLRWVFSLQGPPPCPEFEADPYVGVVMQLNWNSVQGNVLPGRTGPAAHDAAFIAHARADVPRLLAEVRRLRAELQRLSQPAAGGHVEPEA